MIVALRAMPALPTRVLVYGDSIAVGVDAPPPYTLGWVGRLVTYLVGSGAVATEAYGGRELHNDAADSTARAAFTTQLVAYEPTILWLAIGLNDKMTDAWSTAAFATAYGDLIDRVHSANSTITIYAQTPTITTSESANGLGYTLPNYRTAISGLSSGRAWLHIVDGTALISTSDLADGIHPTTAGHGIYYAAVKTILGL